MKPWIPRLFGRSLVLLALASPLILTGCEDAFEPFPFFNLPDTAQLYSLARAEYVDRPGAYDFANRPGFPVVVETSATAPFQFDVAFSEAEDGGFVFVPTGFFPDASARPGILVDDTATFDGLRRAPSDGYEVEEPVAAEPGVIYVVRSRRLPSGCLRYGKMEVLGTSPDGVIEIRTLINPNCSDRDLVPDAEEEEGEAES